MFYFSLSILTLILLLASVLEAKSSLSIVKRDRDVTDCLESYAVFVNGQSVFCKDFSKTIRRCMHSSCLLLDLRSKKVVPGYARSDLVFHGCGRHGGPYESVVHPLTYKADHTKGTLHVSDGWIKEGKFISGMDYYCGFLQSPLRARCTVCEELKVTKPKSDDDS
ncbi:hypothetical protein O181_041900 [Austropuccinia psidii MF-1]|uniref:Secreted protein n=1 Tax=Austropuccinia psidii MF-1 TaxID=1389203 RepID=A0A9Q3DFP8_9BASI|nr:hypothetical protein [Austropuccinia psidii MF-1]